MIGSWLWLSIRDGCLEYGACEVTLPICVRCFAWVLRMPHSAFLLDRGGRRLVVVASCHRGLCLPADGEAGRLFERCADEAQSCGRIASPHVGEMWYIAMHLVSIDC